MRINFVGWTVVHVRVKIQALGMLNAARPGIPTKPAALGAGKHSEVCRVEANFRRIPMTEAVEAFFLGIADPVPFLAPRVIELILRRRSPVIRCLGSRAEAVDVHEVRRVRAPLGSAQRVGQQSGSHHP